METGRTYTPEELDTMRVAFRQWNEIRWPFRDRGEPDTTEQKVQTSVLAGISPEELTVYLRNTYFTVNPEAVFRYFREAFVDVEAEKKYEEFQRRLASENKWLKEWDERERQRKEKDLLAKRENQSWFAYVFGVGP